MAKMKETSGGVALCTSAGLTGNEAQPIIENEALNIAGNHSAKFTIAEDVTIGSISSSPFIVNAGNAVNMDNNVVEIIIPEEGRELKVTSGMTGPILISCGNNYFKLGEDQVLVPCIIKASGEDGIEISPLIDDNTNTDEVDISGENLDIDGVAF